jgi:hypothetical protein
MKKRNYMVLIPVVLLLSQWACKKIEHLPPVPKIEYKSFTVFDTIDILGNRAKGGKLKFYFEDGDGDLGMNTPAADQTDTNNLIITLYRKTAGQMALAPDNDPLKPSSYRIPFMQREGQNKILKGTISVTFLYLFYTSADTIQYEFYVKDRAQNQSNVATTNEIVISQNNTY